MECLTKKNIKMKNDYEKVRTSRNELEAILRILNIKGSTIEKYLDNPYHLRYYQMQRLSTFLNIGVKDIIDIIEIDLKDELIVLDGESNFKVVESLGGKHNE